MPIRLVIEEDREIWNDFLFSSSEGSFLQSWEWGEVQRQLGTKIWRFVIEQDEQWQAVALVMRRDLPFGASWLYGPRLGITGDSFSLLQKQLVEIGEQERAVFVRIDPAVPSTYSEYSTFSKYSSDPADFFLKAGWRKSEREVQPKHTLVLDLTQSEEQLLAGMKSKTRYNVRLAERKEVTVRFSSDPDEVDAFLRLARSVSGRSGFRYHPDEYYRTILSELSKDSEYSTYSPTAELAIAEYEGKPLAIHVMMYAGTTATYAHGASSHEMRELMAPQFLYWQTIRRAKERGMKRYDFFGVAPVDAGPEHPWTGITRVKEGFGGARIDYVGAYDLVLNEVLYTGFNAARRLKNLVH